MEIALNELRPGMTACVTKISCGEAFCRRLRHFGFVPGTVLRCRYRSPDKKVTALELRCTVLAIRTRDLQKIRCEVLP